MLNVVPTGKVQLLPIAGSAELHAEPLSGVPGLVMSKLSLPLPIFQIMSVQLMVCPGEVLATVTGSLSATPYVVLAPLAATDALCCTV